jgi:Transposase DDE domain
MSDFDRAACDRLPLADAALRLLNYATSDEALADTYQRHRGRSYEVDIDFPLFFRLIRDALLQRPTSAHQRFRRAQDEGELDATVEAMYGKLRRVPLPLSQAVLAEPTQRLSQVLPATHDPLPRSLRSFTVLAFDGKKLKYVAKRLKPLRAVRGGVLGGKLLVVQNVATKLAVAVQAHADGEAADNGLVEGAVEQARTLTDRQQRLWLGDRLFCDLNQIPVLAAHGDHFLLRYQSKVGFHADSERPTRAGTTADGLAYWQEWGVLGPPNGKRRQFVRRIHLERPGQDAIILVTNLLDADRYPATDLLAAYLRRWGIETLFLQVTQVFDLRHLISGAPLATVFQAAFVLLLYNVIQVIRTVVADTQKRHPDSISTHILFHDVTKQLNAWSLLLNERQTLDWLHDGLRTATQIRDYLARRLTPLWTDRWNKAPTTKRPPTRPPTRYLKGGHSSAYRILRGEHQLEPETRHHAGIRCSKQ